MASPAGRTHDALTPAGTELAEVVEALGQRGLRWIGELGEEDLDPHLLLWDVRRTVPLDRWPRTKTVVAFEFDDVAGRDGRWWLVVSADEVDVCDVDPGFEVDVTVRTGLRALTRIWRGGPQVGTGPEDGPGCPPRRRCITQSAPRVDRHVCAGHRAGRHPA